jgi:hypothetical protein
MTGDEGLFASLDHYDYLTETIIYGDNGQGDVVGLGKIVSQHQIQLKMFIMFKG